MVVDVDCVGVGQLWMGMGAAWHSMVGAPVPATMPLTLSWSPPVLQSLAARLGVATGKHLAEVSAAGGVGCSPKTLG